MLKQLNISNYALIEQTEVDFVNGLTVITGETGAGKSIMLGALGLILGQRADAGALQDASRKCIVEASFNIQAYQLKPFFERHGLDYEDLTVIRREVMPDGKSRAFVNDTPVNLSVLKELGEYLMDVHSQHETLLLNETNFQFGLVDAFAKTGAEVTAYKTTYLLGQKKKKQLEELQAQEQQARKDSDYLQFQHNELQEAQLKPGELKALESESEALENAETIKTNLSRAAAAIEEGDENVLSALALVKQQLQAIARYGTAYAEFSERINSLFIDLKETSGDISTAAEDVVFDPARLEEVNTQLDRLNRLLKKHGLQNEEELLQLREDLEEKLSQFQSLEQDIEKLNKELQSLGKEIQTQAKAISKHRHAALPFIEEGIKRMLADLAMPNAQFKIELSELAEPGLNGLDAVRFLFSANKGSEFRELYKVASGGELSRLMLCLKAQLAGLKALPTIIFDEIDTGVSGEVADKIGTILSNMGQAMQVITITHLPQIASKGKEHLFVYKTDTAEKTISHIKSLKGDERIVEIAKMLSTGNPTEAAIKNAQDLLKQVG